MDDIDTEFINSIFENVKKDNSLLATLDINDLLKNAEKHSFLENKTLDDILDEKIQLMKKLKINDDTKYLFCDKLADYRYVQNVYEIHRGKHIRWIKKEDSTKLINGAVVTDIIFTDYGVNIQCRGYKGNFFQIKWDACYIFQKLSVNEQLILMVYKYSLQNNSQDKH